MAKCIRWNNDGLTSIQDADAELHRLGISCRAESGTVVEVRIRHNDGEEKPGKVIYKGEEALPLPLAQFKELFKKDELSFS